MSEKTSDYEINEFRKLLREASRIVFFTGAGISTESGISDYRSQGGIWQKYKPVTIQEFIAHKESRAEFWCRKKKFYRQLENAQPNPAHLAIAKLEKTGKVKAIITQNIDGMHQATGSQKVLELHGTNQEIVCLTCKKITSFELIKKKLESGEAIPLCEDCGGLLKTNTISFGQELNVDVLQRAFTFARNCDLMVCVGSTLVVEPAASIPRRAKECGAQLVILNRETTPLYSVADLNIGRTAGSTLEVACKEF